MHPPVSNLVAVVHITAINYWSGGARLFITGNTNQIGTC